MCFPTRLIYYILHLISKSCQDCSHCELSINVLGFATNVQGRDSCQHIACSTVVFRTYMMKELIIIIKITRDTFFIEH